MGYVMGDGRWADTQDVTLLGAGARTANENGAEIELGYRDCIRLTLLVTAASGTTPTLDVAVQTRADANSPWRAAGAFAQATAAGAERKSFTGIDRFVRAVATLGGTTPAFAFSVAGEAV